MGLSTNSSIKCKLRGDYLIRNLCISQPCLNVQQKNIKCDKDESVELAEVLVLLGPLFQAVFLL